MRPKPRIQTACVLAEGVGWSQRRLRFAAANQRVHRALARLVHAVASSADRGIHSEGTKPLVVANAHVQYAWLVFGICSALFGATCSTAGGLSYLDNGQVKVGVDLGMGGSITYLSRSGTNYNIVNSYDLGRQIQQSYYSGPQPYDPNHNVHPNWTNWPWNPIQSGDVYGHRSTVLEHTNTGQSVYVKCRPMQWALNNVPGECTFESWIRLQSNVVIVSNRLVNLRTDTAQQFPAMSQELPAVYTIGKLYRLFSYAGHAPFTGGGLTQLANTGPPWVYWRATESWAALVDANNWGLGVYHPGAVEFVGGFSGTPGVGGPYDNPTGYLSPLHREILDTNIIYTYTYHLILGTLQEIRDWIYAQPYRPGCQYRFVSDRQHWFYLLTSDTGWPLTNHLRASVAGNDPQMWGPACAFYATNAPKIYLHAACKMANPGGRNQGQLFWETNNSGTFSEALSCRFPVLADGQYHTYELNLSATNTYQGLITRLRFDPVISGDAGDYVDVGWISSSPPPPFGRPKFFLFAGQSNMVGVGNRTNLSAPDRLALTNVAVFIADPNHAPPQPFSLTNFWLPLNGFFSNYTAWGYTPGDAWNAMNPGNFNQLPNTYGPEFTTMRDIAKALHEPVFAAKYAVGASGLDASFDPSWDPSAPDRGAPPEYQLSLYHAMIAWASNALANARQTQPDTEPAGFFWMQGETDCISVSTASAYQTNFAKFIQKVRANLGNTNLPFVFGRTSDSQVMNYRSLVRAAQAAVDAADTNAIMVNTDDLPLNIADKIHYTDSGLMTLGQRFAQAWLNLNRPPTATTLPASSLQISNATLNASVTSGGAPTSVCFQYGATDEYGSYSPTNTLPPGSNAVVTSITINGLCPNTTYHYQPMAINRLGMATGAPSTFTTVALPAIASFGLETGPRFFLQLTGTPAASYALEASTNLIQWAIRSNCVIPISGQFQFVETNLDSPPLRFYRLRWP
jgi:hypothetical protein